MDKYGNMVHAFIHNFIRLLKPANIKFCTITGLRFKYPFQTCVLAVTGSLLNNKMIKVNNLCS